MILLSGVFLFLQFIIDSVGKIGLVPLRIKRMIRRADITAFARDIAREFNPAKIILFGSYAYGQPRPDSDVDLLVIMPFEGKGIQKAAEMVRTLKPYFAVDLIVRTPEDVRQRLEWNDYFLQHAVNRGTVLYESTNS